MGAVFFDDRSNGTNIDYLNEEPEPPTLNIVGFVIYILGFLFRLSGV